MSSSFGSCETVRITLWPSGLKASTASSGMPSIHCAPFARHAPRYSSRGSQTNTWKSTVDGDLGEVVRDLGSADHEHAPARAVHAREALRGALAFVGGLARPRSVHSPVARSTRRATMRPRAIRARSASMSSAAHLGLDDHLELAAARQAEAARLLGGHAVGGERGLRGRAYSSRRAHEVVLDAAAGDGAHEDAVVADRGERPRRARARAEGLRDGEEPHAPARAAAIRGRARGRRDRGFACGDVTPGEVGTKQRSGYGPRRWKSSARALRYWSNAGARRGCGGRRPRRG